MRFAAGDGVHEPRELQSAAWGGGELPISQSDIE